LKQELNLLTDSEIEMKGEGSNQAEHRPFNWFQGLKLGANFNYLTKPFLKFFRI